jgi:hypothetical protein
MNTLELALGHALLCAIGDELAQDPDASQVHQLPSDDVAFQRFE